MRTELTVRAIGNYLKINHYEISIRFHKLRSAWGFLPFESDSRNMTQKKFWDKEYSNNKLVTKSDKPQKDFLNFLKFLKKERNLTIENLKILDLGCGVGKNSNYLAKSNNNVTGLDISSVAIKEAKYRAEKLNLDVDFRVSDIGSKLSFNDSYFDLVIDVISSNSLNSKGRKVYLEETARVLKTSGYFFVRALCKDGDKNAKNLLKKFPGKEKNTYTIKGLGLTEKVFEKKEITELYSKYFEILKITKKTAYTRYENQSYKRNYWLLYLSKK